MSEIIGVVKSAVFFDRDGVLNIDNGYTHRKEDFVWMQGAKDAIKWCNDNNYLVIIVTNQAGIARGYYTKEDFLKLTEWMKKELKEYDAHFDAIYYCPHHPVKGLGELNRKCECRKPEPGMLIRAIKEWGIDVSSSILIGDKHSDIQAGEAVNIRSFLFEENNIYQYMIKCIKNSK